jgi:hypothetical protein
MPAASSDCQLEIAIMAVADTDACRIELRTVDGRVVASSSEQVSRDVIGRDIKLLRSAALVAPVNDGGGTEHQPAVRIVVEQVEKRGLFSMRFHGPGNRPIVTANYYTRAAALLDVDLVRRGVRTARVVEVREEVARR